MGELEEVLVLNGELVKVTDRSKQRQEAEWATIHHLIDEYFASDESKA